MMSVFCFLGAFPTIHVFLATFPRPLDVQLFYSIVPAAVPSTAAMALLRDAQ